MKKILFIFAMLFAVVAQGQDAPHQRGKKTGVPVGQEGSFLYQTGGRDSTNSYAPARASQSAPAGGGGAGVSLQTLEERDADTTKGILAQWSPNFVTGADSSDMSLTFYNVQPVSSFTWRYFDRNAAGNYVPYFPPGQQVNSKTNLAFVVQIEDVPTAKVDKSFIVFPFWGVAYQLKGTAFQVGTWTNPSLNGAQSQISPAILTAMTESQFGRLGECPSVADSFSTSRWYTSFFTVVSTQHGSVDINPNQGAGNCYTYPAVPGAPNVSDQIQGFFPLPRLYQSQDPKFTYTMKLGPVPALKRVRIDSVVVLYTKNIGTISTPTGADVYQAFKNSDVVANRYARMDAFYVLSPTSGPATGYSIPSSTTPQKLGSQAAITTSDAPDNMLVYCPAATLTGSATAVPTSGTTPVDCSPVTYNVPALAVGGRSVLTGIGMDTTGRTNNCTLVASCASVMTGYSVTGATISRYDAATAGVQHCPTCNVSIDMVNQTAALTSPVGAQVKTNIIVAGRIIGGTDPNPGSVCTYGGDFGPATSAVSNTYSTTWDANSIGARTLLISCTEGLGSYSAAIVTTMSRSSSRWCAQTSWNTGPGTSVATPAPVYCTP